MKELLDDGHIDKIQKKRISLSNSIHRTLSEEFQIKEDQLNEYTIDIPYSCSVESIMQTRFNRILELDNISFEDVI